MEKYRKGFCEHRRFHVTPERCEEIIGNFISRQREYFNESSEPEPSEHECPACDIMDAFCQKLPPSSQGLCKSLGEQIRSGKITGAEAKKALEESVTDKKALEDARRAAADLAGKSGLE